MSDSDSSDYNVEDYVKPDTVRHTYNNNEDLLSDEDNSDSDSEASQGKSEEESEVDDSDSKIKNSQCKLNGNAVTNGTGEEKPVKAKKTTVPEPAKSNSRFILYVTNLSGETTRSMLEDFFRDAGEIKSIRIPKVRLGNFAFVEMKDFDGYKAGLKFNQKELDGRKIQVYEGSKNKKHSTATAKARKRKHQQQSLSNIKTKKKNMTE